MSSKTPTRKPDSRAEARAERLREALRANLHRRKAQGRARKDSDTVAEDGADMQGIGQEKGE
jgi:hypothetical protein